MKYLKTSEIARAVGVHPNTIRAYEDMGFFSPISRSPSGYRMFTEFHLKQAFFIRTALKTTWLGGEIRKQALSIIFLLAEGNMEEALRQAKAHAGLVRDERKRAENAAKYLEQWSKGRWKETGFEKPLSTAQAAAYLGISIDMLRNWERFGLVKIPRDPSNGYRLYSAKEIQRINVIRALRLARYSVMSIYRMLNKFDEGKADNLTQVLDSLPAGEEDVFYSTDRWLSKVKEIQGYTKQMVRQIEEFLLEKNNS